MTNVYRYAERNRPGTYEGWFIAFMDEAGCLAVLSDYGDYSYRWGGIPEGTGIRRFLTQCEPEYVLRKLSRRDWFDVEKNVAAVRQALLERETGDPEEFYDELRSIGSEYELTRWLEDVDHGLELYDLLPGHSHSPQALAFMERVWPRLMALVRTDLDASPESLSP